MQISNFPCTSTWNCFSGNGKNIEGDTPLQGRRGGRDMVCSRFVRVPFSLPVCVACDARVCRRIALIVNPYATIGKTIAMLVGTVPVLARLALI